MSLFSSELSEEDLIMLDTCDLIQQDMDDMDETDSMLGDTWSMDTFLFDDEQDIRHKPVDFKMDDYFYDIRDNDLSNSFIVPELEYESLPLTDGSCIALSTSPKPCPAFQLYMEDKCQDNITAEDLEPFVANLIQGIEKSLERQENPILLISKHRKDGSCSRTRKVSYEKTKNLFDCYMFILKKCVENWNKGVKSTKRDVFYQNVSLFESQTRVNAIVDSIAQSFGVPRSCLPINASHKGLISGPLTLKMKNGSVIDCSKSTSLIPHEYEIQEILVPNAKNVLVIEKDATFQSLLQHGFTTLFPYTILMTGKGYPDLASRRLLNILGTSVNAEKKHLVCHALMDADPDGLGIMLCYLRGTEQHAQDAVSLTCPKLVWCGLFVSSITSQERWEEYVLYLTHRDRKRIHKLLTQKEIRDDPVMRKELSLMLHGNMKAELQLVSTLAMLKQLTSALLPAPNLQIQNELFNQS